MSFTVHQLKEGVLGTDYSMPNSTVNVYRAGILFIKIDLQDNVHIYTPQDKHFYWNNDIVATRSWVSQSAVSYITVREDTYLDTSSPYLIVVDNDERASNVTIVLPIPSQILGRRFKIFKLSDQYEVLINAPTGISVRGYSLPIRLNRPNEYIEFFCYTPISYLVTDLN